MSDRKSRKITSSIEAAEAEPVRVRMVETVVDGDTIYSGGEFYLVSPEKAEQWVADDKAVDPENPPRCAQCNYEASSKRDLEAHRAVHRAPEQIQLPRDLRCGYCGAVAESEGLLRRHVAFNHGE